MAAAFACVLRRVGVVGELEALRVLAAPPSGPPPLHLDPSSPHHPFAGLATNPKLRDALIEAVKEAAKSAWRTAWLQFVKKALCGTLPVGRSTDSPLLLQLAAVTYAPLLAAKNGFPTPLNHARPHAVSLPR